MRGFFLKKGGLNTLSGGGGWNGWMWSIRLRNQITWVLMMISTHVHHERALARHFFGGLSYDAIDGLSYIDAVFTETLRCAVSLFDCFVVCC